MPESLHIVKPRLAFAKLGTTPTSTAWSQAYNAGNLFACLALSGETGEDSSLQALGKEVLSALEAEFFTLEEKTRESISQAITTSLENLPDTVTADVSVAFFKDDVLYLFIYGAGRILMKREGTIGVLLEKIAEQQTDKPISTASGYVKNNDTIVVQTNAFAQDIKPETMSSALELTLPNDIAEVLSPQVHEKDDGGQAAIIIVYHGASRPEPEEELTTEASASEQSASDEPEEAFPAHHETHKKRLPISLPSLPRGFKKPSLRIPHTKLPHRKKLFLSIAFIMLLLLGTSIYFTKSKQDATNRHEQFISVYEPAQKSYDEGKGLESLNKNLSQEDFKKAEQLIKENLNNFPDGSEEKEQLLTLLAKIEAELTPATPTQQLKTAEKTETDASAFLTFVQKQKGGQAFGHNETTNYVLTKKAISSSEKGTDVTKEIIPNEDAWTNAKSVIPYQGNIYVLDTKKGVLKYVSGGGGYGKRSYFTGETPELSKATSMAIDSTVWILFDDGTVSKYISGEKKSFAVQGLATPFAKTTQLVTNKSMSSLYVLDQGNSRIVQLSKEGAFTAEYPYDILADAQAFDVDEANKKIYVLSQNKIWQIPME